MAHLPVVQQEVGPAAVSGPREQKEGKPAESGRREAHHGLFFSLSRSCSRKTMKLPTAPAKCLPARKVV
jgi:hypothetical protein